MAQQFGSLINLMVGSSKQPVQPKVGMGVTIIHWSDRNAGTIIEVSKSGKTFKFQQDIAKRTDKNGMSEDQEYKYTPDPNATIMEAFQTKDGRWKTKKYGYYLWVGVREEYYDYSF